MKSKILQLVIICAAVIFFESAAWAQTGGTVYGTINDGASSTTLPGATVSVKGMNYGTITDPYGKYVLTGIPAGKVTLLYSYVGYDTDSLEVDITDGAKIEKDITLIMDIVGLSEVVVSSQLLGQTKAINQQLNSDVVMNAVSEDKIKDLPDVNAAEAIGRIPGIAVKRVSGEGQKVMIRGLEPKFSAITINGVRVASNSSTDKSVDLSMISPELLAGIEVYKSPTPDMDADAVGGTVNLVIKKAPEEQKADVKLEGGYNSLNSDFGDYNVSADFSRRFLDKKLGLIAQVNSQRVDRGNNLLGALSYTQNNDLYYKYFELSQVQEARKRAGASLNLDYELGNGNISLYSFYSSTNRDLFSQSERYDALVDKQLRFTNSEQQIDLDILSTALSGDHTLGKIKMDWSLSTSLTHNNTPLNTLMDFRNDNIYTAEPGPFDFNNWVLTANKDYSEAYLRESHSSTNDVNEQASTALANFKLPFQAGGLFSGYFKFGGKYNLTNRSRDLNDKLEPYYYLGGSTVSDAVSRYDGTINYTSRGLISANSFFNDGKPVTSSVFGYPFNVNFDRAMSHDWYSAQNDYYRANRKSDVEDYTVTQAVAAGYVMAKLEFGDYLTIIPGVRLEQSNNKYGGKYCTLSNFYGETGTITDTTTTEKYTDILPHLHLTFKPIQWFSLKASAVKTIARPDYNYITPRTLIDINNNIIQAGNTGLKHMESWNYDLNMSFYNGKYGLFTAGVFYKDMKNIFYRVENYYLASDSIAEANGYPGRKNYYLSTYQNSPEANVYGFEFDLQTNFKYLPAPFNGIVLSANFSRLFSETTKYYFETKDSTFRDPVTGRPRTISQVIPKERKISIPGQVPYIFNLSVGYDYKGFSCRVSGVYQGNYLSVPGTQDIENITVWHFWRWDASVKQKINKYFDVYANLTNLNQQREESYKNLSTSTPDRIQEYGMIFNLGIQAKF